MPGGEPCHSTLSTACGCRCGRHELARCGAVDPEPGRQQAGRRARRYFVERNGLRYAGSHLIIDLWDARHLDDVDAVELALRRAVRAAGASLLHLHLHEFSPNGGISGVAVLAESHISIHTWPERGYAAIDVFMCGAAEPHKVVPILKRAFDAGRIAISRADARRRLMAWLEESWYPHWRQRFEIERIVHQERTGWQELLIFDCADVGRVLVLDGIVQLTERDEFVYHEMLAHVPLVAHGRARDVLIIGGGDGGTLREVLKHGRGERHHGRARPGGRVLLQDPSARRSAGAPSTIRARACCSPTGFGSSPRPGSAST